jgi:hypothetical protein
MERQPSAPTIATELAGLAAVIERWAADLALAEEPSRFMAALDEDSPPAEADS